MARAWIEPNDDPAYWISIDEYEENTLIRSISYISRPFQWTIEEIEPPDYTE